MSRTCYRCKEEKGDGDFYRDRNHPTGYQRQCKACKKSRQDQANREKREAVRKSVTAKICKKCGEIKSLEAFPVHIARRDGRGCYCEKCITPPPKKEKPKPKNPENKVCTKCEEEKPKSEFQKRYDGSGNLESQCKFCRRTRNQRDTEIAKLRRLNSERVRAGRKICGGCKKEKPLSSFTTGNAAGGKKSKCKKCLVVMGKEPLRKLASLCRSRILIALKSRNWQKKKRTRELIGCDYDFLKKHIENQFTEGMSWRNQGDWHIDHIIPLASAKTEEEMIKLAHYSNLQPLWAVDNLRKGDKIA